jgi:hypothetical protein
MNTSKIVDNILKEADLKKSSKNIAYNGPSGKKGTVKTRMSIPIEFDWNEIVYHDRDTKKESSYKSVNIDYNRDVIKDAVEKEIVKIMKKETGYKDIILAGDWASIDFVKGLANENIKHE